MNSKRIFAFTKRTLSQFLHDKRTLGFVMIMPLLMMITFGYTFGGSPQDLTVAVVVKDEGYNVHGLQINISKQVINHLDEEVFNLKYYASMENAHKHLTDGEAKAVIFFPENFTKNIAKRFMGTEENKVSNISLTLDNSNPDIAQTIRSNVAEAVQRTYKDMASTFELEKGTQPIQIESSGIYYVSKDGEIEFIDYFAPGVMSFAIMMVTTMITIILFVHERRHGTLQRLLASPAQEHEIVLGYALGFGLIGLCQSVILLVAALLIFDVMIAGSIVLALLVIILLAFGHQGLGILLSSWAKNELQAIQFIPLIIFPSILLSGLFWSVKAIPEYIRPLSWFVPLKYAISAERAIMIRGWGFPEIWGEIVALVVFALLTLIGSTWLLKRRP